VRPSYPLKVSVADSPGQFDVVLDVTGETAAALPAIARVAEAFLGAARTGMFSQQPELNRPGVELVSSDRHERQARFLWRVGGVQLGAFRVLLNMLEVVDHVEGRLASVSLLSGTGYGERMNAERLVNSPFPSSGAELPFPVSLKRNRDNSREPMIRITFSSAISDADVEALTPWFVTWDRIVALGGYVEALDDRDPDIDVDESLSGQQTYVAARDTIEHLFYEFVGVREAYDAIVNMTVRVHHVYRTVASLEIE
jgi:hypothetical protein